MFSQEGAWKRGEGKKADEKDLGRKQSLGSSPKREGAELIHLILKKVSSVGRWESAAEEDRVRHGEGEYGNLAPILLVKGWRSKMPAKEGGSSKRRSHQIEKSESSTGKENAIFGKGAGCRHTAGRKGHQKTENRVRGGPSEGGKDLRENRRALSRGEEKGILIHRGTSANSRERGINGQREEALPFLR